MMQISFDYESRKKWSLYVKFTKIELRFESIDREEQAAMEKFYRDIIK